MSSLTRTAAAIELRSLFDTAWAGVGKVQYDNVRNTDWLTADGPKARLMIRHAERSRVAIGGAVGDRRFRSTGLLMVQIFQIPGAGLTGPSDLGTIVRDAFEGVVSAGGIEFFEVSVIEVGPDGDFFQTNVTAFFQYDEIR